jgi:hypothetical protein
MTDVVSDIQQAARSVGIGRPSRPSVLPFAVLGLAAAAIGALVAYVLDPQLGRTRRAVTLDRVAGGARRVGRWSARQGRWMGSTAAGLGERLQHETADVESDLDEVAIANRVKSELFRDPEIDKGAISVNVEHDVLFLRGTAPTREQIDDIGHRAGRIDGVGRVVNLLHVPGEPAPVMDEESEAAPPKWAVPAG